MKPMSCAAIPLPASSRSVACAAERLSKSPMTVLAMAPPWLETTSQAKAVPASDFGQRDADQRIAGEDRGELLLVPALGALRPHRHDHVAHVGVRVVHADGDLVREDGSEFPQHGARLADHAAAVVLAL